MKTKFELGLVKRFTGNGRYNVSSPFEDFQHTIDRYVEKYKLELNPDFQRGHVWTQDQQVAFLEYLLKGGTTQPFRFNHPNWMGDFKGEMTCVDGLQRITAILKFLNNDLPIFGGYLKDEIEGVERAMHQIDLFININSLKTREELIQWYIELNEGGTPHTKEEIERVKNLIK